MYSVELGYNAATTRIRSLMEAGFYSEALVTAAFTVEKTVRRTLHQLVISAGFPSRQAHRIMSGYRGLDAIKNAWELYDPLHRKLIQVIQDQTWTQIKSSATMRNKMVHGEQVFLDDKCQRETMALLDALDEIKNTFDREYDYSGWSRITPRTRSRLHQDPKVRVPT